LETIPQICDELTHIVTAQSPHMNKRVATYLIILVVAAAAAIYLKKYQNGGAQTKKEDKTSTQHTKDQTKSNEDIQLRYHGKKVNISKHGRCRMGCRKIDESEIQEVLNKGTENKRKSGQDDKPGQCPTTALEGRTHDGQQVRVIVAECDKIAKIVTVIDLENEHSCHCD